MGRSGSDSWAFSGTLFLLFVRSIQLQHDDFYFILLIYFVIHWWLFLRSLSFLMRDTRECFWMGREEGTLKGRRDTEIRINNIMVNF